MTVYFTQPYTYRGITLKRGDRFMVRNSVAEKLLKQGIVSKIRVHPYPVSMRGFTFTHGG